MKWGPHKSEKVNPPMRLYACGFDPNKWKLYTCVFHASHCGHPECRERDRLWKDLARIWKKA